MTGTVYVTRKTFFLSLSIFIFFGVATFANAATLSLSPSSGSHTVGDIFSVDILLNTQGVAIDGVDINSLNYNPLQLEVQDEDTLTAGIQINPGTLMPITQPNTVDPVVGKITTAQVVSGGTTFSNTIDQVFATVRFKVLQFGTANVTFDFTLGDTTDTNIASRGSDILSSVTNGGYTLDPSSTKFSMGDRVQTTANLNVRSSPSTSGTLLGTQPTGSLGTVIGGPTFADGFWWWQIDYDVAPDGWSVEDFLIAAVNQPPVVSAGVDQTITLPSSASLNVTVTVTDDGLPFGTPITPWFKVSGPVTVIFGNFAAVARTGVNTYLMPILLYLSL